MSYHVSNMGAFGPTHCADMDGFVPEAGDGPWDMNYDHGGMASHNDDGSLTEYGEWWEEEKFPELLRDAAQATEEASDATREWQDANC